MTYNGPTEIGHFTVPGRGTSYYFKLEGHDIQLYVTEKRKKVRVWVDYEELKRPVGGLSVTTQETGR